MKQVLCNFCGVPASKFKGGVCFECSVAGCQMEPGSLIEARAYAYAQKAGLLGRGSRPFFDTLELRTALERPKVARSAPKYFRAAVSCKGLSFSSLDDFPRGIVLRVCHDSANGEFIVGELVWRDTAPMVGGDGLNIVQGAGSIDVGEATENLKGAQFEHTAYTVVCERGVSRVKI